MAKVTIVGSGASGVHFALSVLKKGHQVEMIDVGYSGTTMVNPDDNFIDLKLKLPDPAGYFLGKDYESVVPPDYDQEIYEFPPNKMYLFKHPPGFQAVPEQFEPLFSFGKGGLAEAWTGGSYPFNDEDMKDFPFGFETIKPYYEEVAERIGLIGEKDDLVRYFPWHDHLIAPLELDENSQLILKKYEKKRSILNKQGFYLGRSRIATLSRDKGERKACDYSGRCLWGCPSDSLYVPSLTLEECHRFPNFSYNPGFFVHHFKVNAQKRITSLVSYNLGDHSIREWPVETLVLAAGTLSSSKIYLDSVYKQTGKIITLDGLMDNRQVLVPFINLNMLSKSYNPESYVYHQLAVGFECELTKHYIHGQITTLKTALVHPVIQQIPLDLKTATFLTRNLHSGLGVININFCDTRRADNTVSIEPISGTGPGGCNTRLKIHYQSVTDEKKMIKRAMKRVMKFLLKLGAVAPPMMIQSRPMGASVHYSGTLPMVDNSQPRTLTPDCRSRDFENLFFVDGTSFPFLPAKNLTFTMMANAARVADNLFK
jgi:hypothetical protein